MSKKQVEIEVLHKLHGNIDYLSGLSYLAKKNRHSPTEAENIIWQTLLRYRKTGYKFTRQKPINRFILDFYCSELNLAIEIDGSSHIKKKPVDILRDKFLDKIGIVTIRFTNDQVINCFGEVRQQILEQCSRLSLSRGGAPSLSRGGGVDSIDRNCPSKVK